MFITHKNNVLQNVEDLEWMCRRKSKGLTNPEYWAWLESVTTVTGTPPDTETTVDLSGETGYTIVECTDEDVQERLKQLGDYISSEPEETIYNIKYYTSKRDSEIEGVKSHFIGQDDTKDARILAEKWANIRTRRNRELTESDWVVVKAKEEHPNTSIDSNWMDYRTALRDITDQSDPDNITWPTKPS